MEIDELIVRLRELANWSVANRDNVPSTLPDDLRAAADAIEKLLKEAEELGN